MAEDGFMLAEAEPRKDVTVGSKVLLEKKWEDTRRSVVLVLLMPLVALVAGSVAGFLVARQFVQSTPAQNVIGVISGIALMALSMGIARRYDRKIRASDFGKMKIVGILNKGQRIPRKSINVE
jgi:positive regulator of sigma E activity